MYFAEAYPQHSVKNPKLTKMNDPLVELQRYIDFELFCPQLSEDCYERKEVGGRKKSL